MTKLILNRQRKLIRVKDNHPFQAAGYETIEEEYAAHRKWLESLSLDELQSHSNFLHEQCPQLA